MLSREISSQNVSYCQIFIKLSNRLTKAGLLAAQSRMHINPHPPASACGSNQRQCQLGSAPSGGWTSAVSVAAVPLSFAGTRQPANKQRSHFKMPPVSLTHTPTHTRTHPRSVFICQTFRISALCHKEMWEGCFHQTNKLNFHHRAGSTVTAHGLGRHKEEELGGINAAIRDFSSFI